MICQQKHRSYTKYFKTKLIIIKIFKLPDLKSKIISPVTLTTLLMSYKNIIMIEIYLSINATLSTSRINVWLIEFPIFMTIAKGLSTEMGSMHAIINFKEILERKTTIKVRKRGLLRWKIRRLKWKFRGWDQEAANFGKVSTKINKDLPRKWSLLIIDLHSPVFR